jgi:hypothetical protein
MNGGSTGIAMLVFALLLASCGGGGGGSTTSSVTSQAPSATVPGAPTGITATGADAAVTISFSVLAIPQLVPLGR